MSEQIDHILSLYVAVKAAKKDMDKCAIDVFEDRLDVYEEREAALWSEMERLLAARSGSEPALPVAEHVKNVEKRWKKEVKAEIKREVADLVGRYLADC